MNICTWAGGYPRTLLANEPAEHVEQVAKIGATVLLAAAFATANWTVAGYGFTDGAAWPVRLAAVAFSGVLGAGMVLAIDRTTIYLLDTRGMSAWAILFAMVRVATIMLVSTFTAHITIPVFMRPELEQHALEMRETSESHLAHGLITQYDLSQQQSSATESLKRLQKLEDQAGHVPAELIHESVATDQCWRGYRAKRRSLATALIDPVLVRQELATYAKACAVHEKQAQTDLATWRSETNRRIGEAESLNRREFAALDGAHSTIAQRLRSAGGTEAESLVPASSIVLDDLLAHNAGARQKFWLFVLLLLTVETLPLTSKVLGGRSATGIRIGATQEIAALEQRARLTRREDELRLASGLSTTTTDAMLAAMETAEMKAWMEERFPTQAQAMLPIEAAIRTMRNAIGLQGEAEAMMANSPQLAGMLSGLWMQALRDSIDSLTRQRQATGAAE
ncbi:MAG TPA: DUF4407 domain-containing protein [Rhizomicrobium sp.]|jgi:hypothetical protein|nr:DUF4407 domain-containing protein [Rhizomicrobium sp.]